MPKNQCDPKDLEVLRTGGELVDAAVNLTRPPLLPPLSEGPGQGVGVAKEGDQPTRINPALVPTQPCHRATARPEPRSGWYPDGWGHAYVQTTLDISGLVREDEALRAAANWRPTPPPGSCTMRDNGRSGGSCPHPWRRPVIGPGIGNWAPITENGARRLVLTGLPDPFPAESAWMANWQ